MKNINKLVGDRISEFRKSKEYNQSDMADLLGISRTAYSQMESGHTSITLERLYEISSILGVSILNFLPGEEDVVDIGTHRDFTKEKVEMVLEALESFKKRNKKDK